MLSAPSEDEHARTRKEIRATVASPCMLSLLPREASLSLRGASTCASLVVAQIRVLSLGSLWGSLIRTDGILR